MLLFCCFVLCCPVFHHGYSCRLLRACIVQIVVSAQELLVELWYLVLSYWSIRSMITFIPRVHMMFVTVSVGGCGRRVSTANPPRPFSWCVAIYLQQLLDQWKNSKFTNGASNAGRNLYDRSDAPHPFPCSRLDRDWINPS